MTWTGLVGTYREEKNAKLIITSAQGERSVEFPAFLTSLTNNFSSQWTEEQVYGRQDPIGTFQSTKRTISIGFDIIAPDLNIALSNLETINLLISMLYPSYLPVNDSNALVMSKPPLVRLKFANLLQEKGQPLLGWINSFNANPDLSMGMFTKGSGNDCHFFPKVYNATLDFSPQHTQDLAFNQASGSAVDFPYSGGK